MIGVFASGSDMGTIVKSFAEKGWGVDSGVTYFFAETIRSRVSDFEASYGAGAAQAMKGSFVVNAFNGVGGVLYRGLQDRLRSRFPVAVTCEVPGATDDDGHQLDWRDHDMDGSMNASTPTRCTRGYLDFSGATLGTYVPYSYDSVRRGISYPLGTCACVCVFHALAYGCEVSCERCRDRKLLPGDGGVLYKNRNVYTNIFLILAMSTFPPLVPFVLLFPLYLSR